jgi:hypothetical protein
LDLLEKVIFIVSVLIGLVLVTWAINIYTISPNDAFLIIIPSIASSTAGFMIARWEIRGVPESERKPTLRSLFSEVGTILGMVTYWIVAAVLNDMGSAETTVLGFLTATIVFSIIGSFLANYLYKGAGF